MTFADIYIYRLGAGVTLPSACSGFASQTQSPAILPTTDYGQGLNFRFVITPQVWAISGEVSVGFDGRDGELAAPGIEVALSKQIGADLVRFTIARPVVGGTGLDYARLAVVSAPVQGAGRLYNCVIGIPTIAAELPASPSGTFSRAVLTGTAHVREGSGSRGYSLSRSVVSASADMVLQRVTFSVRLVGTPSSGSGPDIDLGSYAASAPIDPATGNFAAPLTSGERNVTGGISGRLFGPRGVELGVALGASVAATTALPGFTVAGAAFGTR